METVGFVRMADGTAEEYALLGRLHDDYVAGAADRVLRALALLKNSYGGYQVSRYEHSLQTATRALRDGADEETVVCALLHDIGDDLAPENHGELAAAVLRPYVSEENYWLVKHHGIFQGYYYFHHLGLDRDERERYRGHPAFEKTVNFCQSWDQESFDPAYDTLTIEAFEPMVRRLFARTAWQPR
jgi:predicted HD phosphohydrolase